MTAKLAIGDLHVGQTIYLVKRNYGRSRNKFNTWAYEVLVIDLKQKRVQLRTGISEVDWHSDVSRFTTTRPVQRTK